MTDCLEREAVVHEIRGGQARVHADRLSACGSCSVRGGCGAQLLDRHRTDQGVWVDNTIGARVGDPVLLSIPSGQLLAGALGVYLIPLAGLLLGSLIAETLLGAAPAGVAAGAGVGLAGGLVATRWLFRKRGPGRLSLRPNPSTPPFVPRDPKGTTD